MIAKFPASAVRAIPIAPLRCVDCGGTDCIIIVCSHPVTAFCSPDCAAAYGVQPWASADLLVRMRWHEPAPGGSPASQET